MADPLTIELVYPLSDTQKIFTLSLPEGATVGDAIERSGILLKYPEIDLSKNKIGVFSKLVKHDTPLRDGDRVEIYRPLIADPKELRKQRAAGGKKSAGNGEER
ncbi:MAG: RnfH family protein [Candidatus Accumulibacter sp.]|jgi:putative ubiquitin-RnfH superfamily antitoxin RatB of RatAB toxin-antitoxin module|nr:RnfH family protein [Accumulibacter sp.]